MSVHCLKDGRWVVRYTDPQTHKPKTEYFGRGPSAEQRARSRDKALGLKSTRPKSSDASEASFADIAAEYAAYKNFNANSHKMLMIRMTSNILPIIGDINAIRMSHYDLDRFVSVRRKTVSRSTVRREITDIKAVLNWAARRNPPLIPFNPIRDYQSPPSDDAVIIPPTLEELNAILKCANERLVRAIKISCYTGLRPGAVELLTLRWDHVMFDLNVIRVISAEKGGIKMRDIPIHPNFESELRYWSQTDKSPMGFIINDHGKPIKCIRVAWNNAKRRAGITRRLRMYDLRHLFVTRAIELGADYKTLSEIVGSSPETLRKHYQHVSSEAKKGVINNMPKVGI